MTTTITAARSSLTIGSPEWARVITASKISAILGLSRWDSPFSMWHKMAGNAAWRTDDNAEEKARGHYLEPAVRQWYREHHAGYQVDKNAATWINNKRAWQGSSPDGMIFRRDVKRTPLGLFEGKTDNLYWQWGAEGTDEIPQGYRAQGMWQMDTFGLPFVDFAVLDSNLTFRQYHLEYDRAEAADMRDRARAFLDSIEAGKPPAYDSHSETYRVVRELHPDIEAVTVEVDRELAVAYVTAISNVEIATDEFAAQTTLLAAAVGSGRAAICNDVILATRQSNKGGTPFLRRSNGLTSKFTLPERQAS